MKVNTNQNPTQEENLETEFSENNAKMNAIRKRNKKGTVKMEDQILPPMQNVFEKNQKNINSDIKKVYILPSNQGNSYEVSLQGELFLNDMLNDAETTRERFNESLEKVNSIVRQALTRQIFAKKIEVNTKAKKFIYLSFIFTIVSFICTGIAAKYGD